MGRFTVWDYVVFAAMLLISAIIGIYYAFVGGGQKTSKDFLMAGRSMNALPVALSLTASFMSAVTVLGTPAEIYRYGAIFCVFAITYGLVVLCSAEIFLPVFYKLGITSTYEHYEDITVAERTPSRGTLTDLRSGPIKFNKPVCKVLHMDWGNHKYQYRLKDELIGSSLAEEIFEILVDEKFDRVRKSGHSPESQFCPSPKEVQLGSQHKKGMNLLERVQRMTTKMVLGVELLSCEEKLRKMGLIVKLEEKAVERPYCSLSKGAYDRGGERLFTKAYSGRTKDNSFKLKEAHADSHCMNTNASFILVLFPSLSVTGFDLWGAVVATGVVCTFYCTLGGLKAVVWTDVFQVGIMVAGFSSVIIRAVVVQEGIGRIVNDSYHGGRLNFWDFDPNPLQRHTFWTIVIGGTFTWTGIYGVNQSQVQRYIACKSRFHAKLSLYINLVGLWAILACATLCGLAIYSIYKDCDPWTANQVSALDQLMPYLVLDIMRDYPGVPGLFVASAYSGTLSTVSSSINALAAVTVEDLIKPYFKSLSEKKLSWISMGMSMSGKHIFCFCFTKAVKLIRAEVGKTSLFYGGVCIAMAAVASLLGALLQYLIVDFLPQAALSIFGMVGGPLLGLFALGILCSFANGIGAFVGLVSGFIISLWVGIGSQIYPPLPERTKPLYLSTAGCNISSGNLTSTEIPLTTVFSTPGAERYMSSSSAVTKHVFSLKKHKKLTLFLLYFRPALADNWYSLSYLYFSTLGTLVTVVVGIIISLLTGGLKQNTDRKFLLTKEDFLSNFSWSETEQPEKVEVLNWKPFTMADEGTDNPAFSHIEMDVASDKNKVNGLHI
ncbi:Sodium-coupled monocarboxylate transporter 1 [Lonchura striata]|uniref:Sodium-coupled monocarboxylate transporter 1 n=1 Tax=Lonchura striata TaxID=40157 RepID=A0A218UZS0_9PASE|nr:Sodium-coupled monocarboxylate transporter 1 [Lonchura striata domestica]